MAKGTIKINNERCKGCMLCMSVCPKQCIELSTDFNKKGYFFVEIVNDKCTGCSLCAIMCPDIAIEVYRD